MSVLYTSVSENKHESTHGSELQEKTGATDNVEKSTTPTKDLTPPKSPLDD